MRNLVGLVLVTLWLSGMAAANAHADALDTALKRCRILEEHAPGLSCRLTEVKPNEFHLVAIATSQKELTAVTPAMKAIAGLACLKNTLTMTVGFLLTETTAQVTDAVCDPPGPKIRDFGGWRVVSTTATGSDS